MEEAGKYWNVGNTIDVGEQARDIPFSGGLYTERLRLRRLIESDATTIQHMVSNWEVAKQTMSFPTPYTLDHALEFVRSAETEWNAGSQYVLGMERIRDEVLIGAISATVSRPFLRRHTEVGYWIGEEFWGQGLTSEAVTAFLQFCRQGLGLTRMTARVFAENEASLRLLENQGFNIHRQRTEHLPERGGKRKIIHLRSRKK